MNRLTSAIILFGLSILLVQCTAKKTAKNTMTDEEVVASVKKQYTDSQMEEGKAVYQSSCGKCHALFEPESRTIHKWEKVLPRMSKRANLETADAGKVRAYLLTHAKSS
ncbi:MAG: hypothetical protein R2800_04255 [Flavipsychrobacter sp.]